MKVKISTNIYGTPTKLHLDAKKETELEPKKINDALKEFHYYQYCNKSDGDVCEHIHCICGILHISDCVTVTCSRDKYGK